MGVRTTTQLVRSASAPNISQAYTMAGWLRRVSGEVYFVVNDSANMKYEQVRWSITGSLTLSNEFGFASVPGAAVAQEYCFLSVVRRSPTEAVAYVNAVEVGTFAPGDVSGRPPAVRLMIATLGAVAVDAAYWRVWEAALSESELAAEMASPIPVRAADLWADWELATAGDLSDHSGNGRHMSSFGGLSTVDDPLGIVRPLDLVTGAPVLGSPAVLFAVPLDLVTGAPVLGSPAVLTEERPTPPGRTLRVTLDIRRLEVEADLRISFVAP